MLPKYKSFNINDLGLDLVSEPGAKHIVGPGHRDYRDILGVEQGLLFTLERLDGINQIKSKSQSFTNVYLIRSGTIMSKM